MKRQKDIKYSERLVAFIDILGFSHIINSDSNNDIENIKFFDENLRHVVKVLKDEYGKIFSIKMFSDCICLSCEHDPEKFEYILAELSYIQLHFSTSGIFIRGGFAKGLHFENELLIYSKGLIQAYELEKSAIYPRILISSEVVDLIKHELVNKRKDGKNYYLMKSPDGSYFLDYLDWLYSEGAEQNDFLSYHKNSIINQLKKNKSNARITEMYKWLSEYHNIKVDEFNPEEEFFEDAYQKIKDSLFIDIETMFPNFEKA